MSESSALKVWFKSWDPQLGKESASQKKIQKGKLLDFFHIDDCKAGLSITQGLSHLYSSPPNDLSEQELMVWDERGLFWANKFSWGQ